MVLPNLNVNWTFFTLSINITLRNQQDDKQVSRNNNVINSGDQAENK